MRGASGCPQQHGKTAGTPHPPSSTLRAHTAERRRRVPGARAVRHRAPSVSLSAHPRRQTPHPLRRLAHAAQAPAQGRRGQRPQGKGPPGGGCCSSVDASAGRQSSGCLDSWLLLGSSLHGSRSRYRSRVELRLSTVRRIINVDGWTADPRSFCIPAVAPHPLPHIAWWVKAPSNCLPHTRLSAENVGSLVFRLGVQGSYPTSCYVRLPAN